MKLRSYPLFLLYLLFFFSCAKQSTPTGGPKDSIPPILVRSIPKQKELNFKSKQIQLDFSEMIILNNPKEQIIITPAIGKDYEIKANKNSVKIIFPTDFKDSTTYTLNFRESIQDITEKNTVKNLQLAFSTGTFIDSMSIEGKVYNLLKGQEVKDATIALYTNADTFNIFKHKPIYLTKTNSKGEFKIENLKVNSYYIYSFEDKNKNLIVDSKSESYGFLSTVIQLNKNIKNIALQLVRLDTRSLKISSARPYENYFNIKTSKNLMHYTIKADSTTSIISTYAEDHANVKVYNTMNLIDSLKIRFRAYDSINNAVDSSFYLKFNKREVEKEKFTNKLTENTIQANKGLINIGLSFSKPIKSINYDSIYLTIDSLNIISFTKSDLIIDSAMNEVSITKIVDKKIFTTLDVQDEKKNRSANTKSTKKKSNTLTIGKGSFISIEDDSSALITETSKVLKEEETGILIINIKTDEKNFIVDLMDKNYKPISSLKNKKEFKIENLPAGNYTIKLVIDKNGNGRWDAGNYFKREEPETIIFYRTEKGDQTINLKANWEVGPLLITY